MGQRGPKETNMRSNLDNVCSKNKKTGRADEEEHMLGVTSNSETVCELEVVSRVKD